LIFLSKRTSYIYVRSLLKKIRVSLDGLMHFSHENGITLQIEEYLGECCIIGARAQSSDGDFCLQLCKDFFLSHEKTPLYLYYRNCGLPSIKEFWYDESSSKTSVRVT